MRHLTRPAKLYILVVFLDGLFFSGWNLFLNLYILSAGFDRPFLGLVNAAPAISALFLGVPMGLLAARIGFKRAMLIGFVGSSLALLVEAVVLQPVVMIAAGLVAGVLSQLYILSQAPFMMQVSDDRSRDALFSISFGMFPFASTAGSLMAGVLPGLFASWLSVSPESAEVYRAVLVFSVVLSQLAMLPLLLVRFPDSRPGKSLAPTARVVEAGGEEDEPRSATRPGLLENLTPLLRTLTRPLTLRLAIPNLMIGLGAAMLIPYMNVFFVEYHGLDDATLGVLFGVSSLLTGLACFAGPRLVRNLGSKVRVVVIGQAVSLVFLFVIGFVPWVWLSAFGFLIRGALMNMVAPLFDAFALEQTPAAEHSAVNSVRALAWNIGWAIGPFASGLVQQTYGFTPLFVITAVLYAAAISITWVYFGNRRALSHA